MGILTLRRILMWDEYPYHPLRKDFPLAGIEVPLPADDVTKATGAAVLNEVKQNLENPVLMLV